MGKSSIPPKLGGRLLTGHSEHPGYLSDPMSMRHLIHQRPNLVLGQCLRHLVARIEAWVVVEEVGKVVELLSGDAKGLVVLYSSIQEYGGRGAIDAWEGVCLLRARRTIEIVCGIDSVVEEAELP